MSGTVELDHLFRHATAQVVAALARALGQDRLDVAEEATQDAVVKALEVWRFQGVPANPRGWLFRTARNRALDLLRREASYAGKLALLPAAEEAPPGALFEDAELALVFLCCHPRLSVDARLALTLKLAGGFTVAEIAAAFLADPATIAQRIVRAKRALQGVDDVVELTDAADIAQRLDSVLESLYLLFSEGYDAHGGEALVRAELCTEAIRLVRLIVADARTSLPHAQALLALMLFQASRLPARLDAAGDLVLLSEQDRSLWDRGMLAEAWTHFAACARGDRLTGWHVQAAIAATHAAAPSYDATDWPMLLRLYDQYHELEPTPVVALNRAIVRAQVHGAGAGMAEALPLLEHAAMRRYYLLPATLAAFADRLGDTTAAAAYYRSALRLPCNAVEHRFLERRLALLQSGG